MKTGTFRFLILLALACLPMCTGCAVLHELKPWRTKRWNHNYEGMPSNAYESFYRPNAIPESAYFASRTDSPSQAKPFLHAAAKKV